MQFYHWDWEYIMGMSLRLFWTMVKSMRRIKAAENLRWIRINGFANLADKDRKEYIAEQEKIIGTISVSDQRDTEGLKKLKNLG